MIEVHNILEGKENAGFRLVRLISISNAYFVLGVNDNLLDKDTTCPYVTWETDKEVKDFYWGHYFNDRYSAERDLILRAGRKVAYFDKLMEKTTEFKAVDTPDDIKTDERADNIFTEPIDYKHLIEKAEKSPLFKEHTMFRVDLVKDTKGHDVESRVFNADVFHLRIEKGCRCFEFFNSSGPVASFSAENVVAIQKL